MPYYDYQFDKSYFEGGTEYGYSAYNRGFLPFEGYADAIKNQVSSDISGADVLIAGCAHGFTLEWLVNKYDVNAYGIDISQYAVNQSPVGNRIINGDVLTDAKNTTDFIKGKYDFAITESLLSCLTDQEASDACRELDKISNNLAHVVWTTDSALNTDYYNGHTLEEWKGICGEAEWIKRVDLTNAATI